METTAYQGVIQSGSGAPSAPELPALKQMLMERFAHMAKSAERIHMALDRIHGSRPTPLRGEDSAKVTEPPTALAGLRASIISAAAIETMLNEAANRLDSIA